MSIFIYNHRTNIRVDIPEGYAPIPSDFPVEEGDLTYVRNPFSKPGIVDVLVPGVWVARHGSDSYIPESISIRPIRPVWNVSVEDLLKYLNSEQFSEDIARSTSATVSKEIAETIRKRKEVAAFPRTKTAKDYIEPTTKHGYCNLPAAWYEAIAASDVPQYITVEVMKLRVSDIATADKINYLFSSICGAPPLPGHDRARRYFRGKKN